MVGYPFLTHQNFYLRSEIYISAAVAFAAVRACASRDSCSEAPKSVTKGRRHSLPLTGNQSPPSPTLAPVADAPADTQPVAQGDPSPAKAATEPTSLFFIPDEFQVMIQDEREWRLVEDHLLRVITNEQGYKEWRFLRGIVSEGVSYSLVLPFTHLEEKLVSGNAKEVPVVERAFTSLKLPPPPSIYEAEARKLRRQRILTFVDVEKQPCAGPWVGRVPQMTMLCWW